MSPSMRFDWPRPGGPDAPGSPSSPGSHDLPWVVPLEERLFEHRVVVVAGELDVERANRTSAELMTLDATGDDYVDLHLDCHGGTLQSALALMDVVELLGVDVHATAIGQVSGPAVGIMAVAPVRQATPHARIRLTEPTAVFDGPGREVDAWVADQRHQLDRFCERVARATGQPRSTIEADLAAGRILDAEAAVEYGLVDDICRPAATIHRLRPHPFGFRRR